MLSFSCRAVGSKGFSLLELIMVLTLAGILLAVASPRWPESVFLSAQAEQLAQDIRYTQALAMGLKESTFIIQREAENSYEILDQNGDVLHAYPLVLEGVVISPFSVSFSYPMGFPGLADTTIHLSKGDESQDLTVVGLTGAVIIQP